MDKVRLFFSLVVFTTLLVAAVITGFLTNLMTSPNLTRIIVGETNIGPGLILFVYIGICLGVLWGWIKLFR